MFTLSHHFWRRLNFVAGLFVLVTTFGLLVFMAHLEVKDLDLWLHIGVGRFIVENGFRIPTEDILSCTIAGKPWVNHEWLFQVIVYWIHSHWGPDGLISMQVWLVTGTMLLLLFLGYSRKNQLPIYFALFLVSLIYQGRFTIRPELYSLLFFVINVIILAMFMNRKWSVWALFAVQVIWANMHGFFFFGPLLVLITWLGEWLKRHVWLPWDWKNVARLNDQEYRRVKVALLLVVLACFLTPTGVHGAIYPLSVFFQISGDSKIFFSKIVELKKPITQETLFVMTDWPYYRLMIIISFLSFVFNRKKIDVGMLIFWIFFLIFSLAAIRNMVFFAFAGYLAIVANLATIRFKDIVPVRFTEMKFLFITAIFAQVLLVAWTIDYYREVKHNGYFDFQTYQRKSEFGGVSQRQFPTQAVNFLAENKVRGNFYNDFNSGAYLVGNVFPDIKVFIDGRTEVYGPEFFKFYQSIQEEDKVDQFVSAVKRFEITGVLLNTVHGPAPVNILKHLYENNDWVLVYFDYDGLIFLKNIPINREIINRHRVDLAKWSAKAMDIYRLGSRDVSPYQNLNRAFTLESIGLDSPALAEARAALDVNPAYTGPYKIIGKIAAKNKDFKTAYENFRVAASLSFNDQNARVNMAQALLDLQRYDEAALQYQKIIEIWPNHARAHLKYARAEIYRKNYDKAFSLIRKGFSLALDEFEEVIGLAELLFEIREYSRAEQIYLYLIEKRPQTVKAYFNLCVILERTQGRDAAIALLKKGLGHNPENQELKERLRAYGYLPDTSRNQ